MGRVETEGEQWLLVAMQHYILMCCAFLGPGEAILASWMILAAAASRFPVPVCTSVHSESSYLSKLLTWWLIAAPCVVVKKEKDRTRFLTCH